MGENVGLSDIGALLQAYRGNNGDGGFNGEGGLLLLVIILLFGGWGGNRGGWGNNGGGGGGYAGGDALYPWLNQADQINDGFRDQMIQTGINGLQQGMTAGFASLAQQLCSCCGDMQMAVANGFFGVENGANARQMANMQQLFGMQTAMMQGFSNDQLTTAQQTAALLAEHCSDRQALNEGVRDIIANQTASVQLVLDKLCQQELDAERRSNDQLRQELAMANLAASQQAQNAFIAQGFANEVDQLYNRLNTCPVPSMPVYGRTPIFTCQPQNQGCGCGCAA